MQQENIAKLQAMLQGKLNEKDLNTLCKKLQSVDDSNYDALANQAQHLKSQGLTFVLNLFHMGSAYLGSFMSSFRWYIIAAIGVAMPFIFEFLEGVFKNNVLEVGGWIIAVIIGIILILWYIIDLFSSFSDTKKENYKLMTSVL